MKALIVAVVILIINQQAKSQNTNELDLTGLYIIDLYRQTTLMICEDSRWHYTNCSVPQLAVHELMNACDSIIVEANGTYYLEDSVLYLKNLYDSLLLKLKVVDTLNLQIIFSSGILNQGLYLNRTTAYFSGYKCFYDLENIEFIRWVFGSHDELYRFSSTGDFFKSKKYTVEKVKSGYWRTNLCKKK